MFRSDGVAVTETGAKQGDDARWHIGPADESDRDSAAVVPREEADKP